MSEDQGQSNEFRLTDLGLSRYDMSNPRVLSKEDLDRLRPRFAEQHVWVIHVVHTIDDPEVALDDMTLDMDTIVGLTAIHCFFCHHDYAWVKEWGETCAGG